MLEEEKEEEEEEEEACICEKKFVPRFAKGDDRDYSGAGHRGQSFLTKLLDDTRHVLADTRLASLSLVIVENWEGSISIVKSGKNLYK